jgi:hypothetical protein
MACWIAMSLPSMKVRSEVWLMGRVEMDGIYARTGWAYYTSTGSYSQELWWMHQWTLNGYKRS